jgi:hypothetical protein
MLVHQIPRKPAPFSAQSASKLDAAEQRDNIDTAGVDSKRVGTVKVKEKSSE